MTETRFDTERLFLASVMFADKGASETIAHCVGQLTPDDFSNPNNRDTFRAIDHVVKQGELPDIPTVGKRLIEINGPVTWAAGLSDHIIPTPSALEKITKNLLTISRKRNGAKQFPPIEVISGIDLLKREFPPRRNILDPWLPEQGIAMLHAYRGVGKTQVSVGITAACVTGSKFLRWEAEYPVCVMFLDGEMPGPVIQERFAQAFSHMDGTGKAGLNIITPDLQGDYGMPDLSTTEGQARLEPYITKEIKLIVVDNISTLCRSTQENKGDTWLPVQEWALKMRARGKSVLLVHHDGKGGQQRGTSRKEDILDAVIQLKHPADYTPDQGAMFEVHFRKARGIYGEDVKPFIAQLSNMEGGQLGWVTSDIEDSLQEKVKRLLDDGYKQRDVAEELGITAGYVSKLAKKIKAEK